MRGAGRIAHVGASGIIAMFVGKHTVEYIKFFAVGMSMLGKVAVFLVFD